MTDPVLVALIASVAPSAAVIVAYLLAHRDRQAKAESASLKLDQIHVLVNSRLSEALDEIAALKAKLEDL